MSKPVSLLWRQRKSNSCKAYRQLSAPGSMGKAAAGGALYVGGSQGVRVILTIASTIVVARILSPEDYGIAAMAAPVTAFLLLFQNLGLNQATIQARTLSQHQSNAMFWLNMTASLAVTLIILALSPLVAWFYDDPRPGYFTAASAATVLLSGSALQHAALLNRELRFKAISFIDIASALTAFAATVTAAILLRSYWALWFGGLFGTLANVLLVWRSSRWRPNFSLSFRGMGAMARFGGSITGFNLLNFMSRNLDTVLIAKVWGAASAGLYDRSYKLMLFPIQNINAPLSRVMIPVLSRLVDEPERYRRSYLRTVQAIMMLSTPAVAVAGATSEQLVPLLLGKAWAAAAPIFQWLSVTALFSPLANATGWLFVSTGRGGSMLRWGAVATSMSIVAFSIGVHWGAVGVAIAYSVSTTAKLPILFPWSARGTAVRAIDLYLVSIPALAAAAAAWLAAEWLSERLSILPLLIVSLVIAYGLNLLCYSLGRERRESLLEMLALASRTLRRA